MSSESTAFLLCAFWSNIYDLSPYSSYLCVNSLLEKKVEALQGYMAKHKDQIHLIIQLVLAAGKLSVFVSVKV